MTDASDVVITYETLFELYRREKSRDELQKLDPGFYARVTEHVKTLRKIDASVSDDQLEQKRLQAINIKKILKEIYSRRERKVMNMALIKVVTPQSIIDLTTMLEHEKMIFERMCELLKLKRMQTLSQLENNGSYAMNMTTTPAAQPAVQASPQPAPAEQPPTQEPGVEQASPQTETQSASVPGTQEAKPETLTAQPEAPIENPTTAEEPGETSPVKMQFKEDQPKFIGPNLEIYGPFQAGDTAELPKVIADIILEKGNGTVVE